jgi:hypothetical protein
MAWAHLAVGDVPAASTSTNCREHGDGAAAHELPTVADNMACCEGEPCACGMPPSVAASLPILEYSPMTPRVPELPASDTLAVFIDDALRPPIH